MTPILVIFEVFMEVLLVIFLAVLLRGTFAMSLAQRTRMLGQLASVGATRRQLRQSVWLDAFFLALQVNRSGSSHTDTAMMCIIWLV